MSVPAGPSRHPIIDYNMIIAADAAGSLRLAPGSLSLRLIDNAAGVCRERLGLCRSRCSKATLPWPQQRPWQLPSFGNESLYLCSFGVHGNFISG